MLAVGHPSRKYKGRGETEVSGIADRNVRDGIAERLGWVALAG